MLSDTEVYFVLSCYAALLFGFLAIGFLAVATADALMAWRRGESPRAAFIEFWRQG